MKTLRAFLIEKWSQIPINKNILSGFVILSILLEGFRRAFYINEIFNIPQFKDVDLFAKFCEQLTEHKSFLYNSFFLVDYIWTFFLLWILWTWSRKNFKYSPETASWKEILLTLPFLLTYFLDGFENALYLKLTPSFSSNFFSSIISTKNLFYGLSFSLFTISFLQSQKGFIGSLWKFFKNAFFSIFIVSTLLILLFFVPQAGSLIIDLLDKSPISYGITYFHIVFTALIIFEFPLYFLFLGSQKSNSDTLFYLNNSFSLFGLGVIFYAKDKMNICETPSATKEDRKEGTFKTWRHFLGFSIFIIWLFAFLRIFSKYFGSSQWSFLGPLLFFIFVAVYIAVYFHKAAQKKKLKYSLLDLKQTLFCTPNPDPKIVQKKKEKLNCQIQAFFYYYDLVLLLTVLTFFINLGCIYILGWHFATLVITFINIFLGGLSTILFIVTRSFFILYYGAKEESVKRLQYEHLDKAGLLNQTQLISVWGKLLFLHKDFLHWGSFSDNGFYIGFYRAFALLIFFLLFMCNVMPGHLSFLNPIPILLAYLITFYYALTVIIKHLLFYNHQEKAENFTIPEGEHTAKEQLLWTIIKNKSKESWKKFHLKYKFIIPALPVLGLIGLFGSAMIDNDLHTIQQTQESRDDLVQLNQVQKSPNEKSLYFAASGGGLKAALWTMFTLNEFDFGTNSFNSDSLFIKSQAISGVSGGGIGLANYSNILYSSHNPKEINQRIKDLGTANILTIDVIYFLGRDLFREIIPFNIFKGSDRANKKMSLYCQLTTDNDPKNNEYFSDSFRKYWKKIREKYQGHFPNLIINAVSTNGQHGVASAVALDSTNFFPNAIDMLSFEDESSLTFAGAVSTTNRFPIMSPTARIKSKGHFLDGGYLDNSGLITLLHYIDRLERNNKVENAIIVQISNDRSNYIAQLFDPKFYCPFCEEINLCGKTDLLVLNKEKISGEISAVLKTIADTESVPNLKRQEIEDAEFRNYQINLPFYVSYQQVIDYLGGEPPKEYKLKILECIEKNNSLLDNLLEAEGYNILIKGRPVPPLGRMLSYSDVLFQEIMIKNHPFIQSQIHSIRSEFE